MAALNQFLVFTCGLAVALLSSCAKRNFNKDGKEIKSSSISSSSLTFEDYLSECSSALEVPLSSMPAIDCTNGGIVEITVHGKKISHTDFKKGMMCDNPSLIANQSLSCLPNSWAGTIEVADTPTQFVFLCRQFTARPSESNLADVIGLIARNKRTGATCFFESKETPSGINLKQTPRLQTDLGKVFWKTPQEMVNSPGSDCVTCHNGVPWLRTAFIKSLTAGRNAWIPMNHGEKSNSDPLYWVVSAEKLEALNPKISWTPQKLEAIGAEKTCTGCHRVGAGIFCKSYAPISLGEKPSPVRLGSALLEKTFPEKNLHWNVYDTKLKRFDSEDEWHKSMYYKGLKAVEACCDVTGPTCRWTPLTEKQP